MTGMIHDYVSIYGSRQAFHRQSSLGSLNRLRRARWSSGQAPKEVLNQLQRVAELQKRVAAENSKDRKATIIAEYPDLRDLLEQ